MPRSLRALAVAGALVVAAPALPSLASTPPAGTEATASAPTLAAATLPSQLGAGWSAVTSEPLTPVNTVDNTKLPSLVLISPTGSRFRVATVPRGAMAQEISGDGRRVFLYQQRIAPAYSRILVYDVPTRRLSGHDVPATGPQVTLAHVSKPGGLVTYVEARGATTSRVYRTTLSGAVLSSVGLSHPGGWLPTLDGTLIATIRPGVVGTLPVEDLVLRSAATGAVSRVVSRVPAGYAHCRVTHWDASGRVVVTCWQSNFNEIHGCDGTASYSRVFRVDLSTGRWSAMTKVYTFPIAPGESGFNNAWSVTGGAVLDTDTPGCPRSWGLRAPDLSLTPIHTVAPAVPDCSGLVTVVGNVAHFVTEGCIYFPWKPSSYGTVDVTTGRVVWKAGVKVERTTVTSVATFDRLG